MNKTRCSFSSDFVENNSDDQGKRFRAIKKLLVEKDVLFFPGCDKTMLVNDLGNFLGKKFHESALNWTLVVSTNL